MAYEGQLLAPLFNVVFQRPTRHSGTILILKQLKVPFKKELVPVPVPFQKQELVPRPVPLLRKGTSSSSSSFSSSFWGSIMKEFEGKGAPSTHSHTHLKRDKTQSNLSVVPGIQVYHENTLIQSFEMRPQLICLQASTNIPFGPAPGLSLCLG